MNNFLRSRNFFRQNLFVLLGLCLFVYFSYHSIAGQRSVLALGHVRAELEKTHLQLADLQERRSEFEYKVVMLRPESLNLDYAEELIVQALGYHSSEQISVVGLSPNVAQQ